MNILHFMDCTPIFHSHNGHKYLLFKACDQSSKVFDTDFHTVWITPNATQKSLKLAVQMFQCKQTD